MASGAQTTAPQGQSVGRMGKGFGLLGTRDKNNQNANGYEPTVIGLLLLLFVELALYVGARMFFGAQAHGG